MKLYDKALVTIDQMGNQLTRDRIRQFSSLNCNEVYLCYIATEHIIAGEVEVTIEDGTVIHAGPGDIMVTPKGSKGYWKNLSPVRKFWAVFEE